MTEIAGARRFSNEQLSNLLELLKEADSVELKLTVPESMRRSAVGALDLDPLDAQLRQVYFFDTPDLALNQAGVVVRARRRQGEPNDTVVKLRPVDPSKLPVKLKKQRDFVVEVDAMSTGFVCSGSFKGGLEGDEVPSVVKGNTPIRKLFSRDQRDFYEEHAPSGIKLDDLSILGPITVAKLKVVPEGFGRRVVVELWNYPDGSRILELSTKCTPDEAFNVAAQSRAFLAEKGIEVIGEQPTKTKTALEFFVKELNADS